MFKLYLAVITLGLIAQINCQNVPALIFGDKTSTFLPALQHISGDEFVTLVKSQADKDTLTVVFVENKLSVEDLSQCKLNTKTCFENLRKTDKTYLSSVEQPVDSLISAFGEENKKSISVNSDDDLSEANVNGEKILFVYLDDVERPEDFSKHDELIAKLLQQLQSKYGDVVAIYTGIHPSFKYSQSLKRHVREAEPADNVVPAEQAAPAPAPSTEKPVETPKAQEDGAELPVKVFKSDQHVLLALRKMTIQSRETPDAPEVDVDVKTMTLTVSNETETGFVAKLVSGEHKLELITMTSAGTWEVHFTYNDIPDTQERLHPRSAVVGFGETWSFGCGDLIIESFKRSIRIVGFQYQPTFQPTEEVAPENRKFSDNVNDCVGFFSPGIWGALFIVILLISIMGYGLTMMMDIKTMDKFDDPKGKTITINAQE